MSKKSQWCGKKLKICYKSKCTIATVTDACPGCNKGNVYAQNKQKYRSTYILLLLL